MKKMDKSNIKAIANKALMAANRRYHSWSEQKQEQFRATISEAAQQKIETVLLKNILGIECTAKNASKIWHDLPLEKLDNLNWATLYTAGIGEDYVFLNEHMKKNTSLLDFNTLYDFDYADYLYQEQANKKDFKDYKARDYYAIGFTRWLRLIINERFCYATLYSLAGYLTDAIEEKSHDYIEQLIPHKYVEGTENGKPVKGGYQWDMKIDAGGKEKQLTELNSRYYRYTQQRWIELSKEFEKAEPTIYFEDIKQHGEYNRNFIFNNGETLKKIRWKHFLTDCEPLTADLCSVTERAKQEVTSAKTYLQEAYEDIMKNFDPNVIKLKKKMKIVIAPGALDGRMNDVLDDESDE